MYQVTRLERLLWVMYKASLITRHWRAQSITDSISEWCVNS